jgi:cobalt-zinc-cadmium efflux system membrane fusion protein
MKTIYLFLFVLVLSVVGCKKTAVEVNETEQHEEVAEKTVAITREQYDAIGVKLGMIEQKNLKEVVKATGYLKVPPQNQASVSAFLGSVVKSIKVVEGDYVKKGQILGSLEHPDYIKLQEDYLTTKSNLSYQEKEFIRQKELNEQNVSSGKVFQQTEANYNSEKARLLSLESQLKMLSISLDELSSGRITPEIPIISPINGYISRINTSIGHYAEPSKPFFEIVDNSHIHVDLLVYEKDLFKVKEGQKINFVLTNQNNKQIQGTIFGIGKAFENETKAVSVHAEIKDNEKHRLIAGMFVNALIDVGEQKVSAVPVDAIIKSDGKNFIFISKGKEDDHITFEMIEVRTGVTDLGYTEIIPLDSVADHSKIVVKSAFFLLSKIKEGEGGEEH